MHGRFLAYDDSAPISGFADWNWRNGSAVLHLLCAEGAAILTRVPESWVYANADQIPVILRLRRLVRFRPAIRYATRNASSGETFHVFQSLHGLGNAKTTGRYFRIRSERKRMGTSA